MFVWCYCRRWRWPCPLSTMYLAMSTCVSMVTTVNWRLSNHSIVTINHSTNQSINQSSNQSWKTLSSIVTSRLNCYSNKAVGQSVKDRSDDEVWIRLSEEPCLEMLTEWRQRLSWRRLLWQGVPAAWSSNRETTATDGREPDGRHQQAIGAVL